MPWEAKPSGAASILEYAVKFSDGIVKGPAPFACEHALFASGVSAPDELFGGRLKGSGGDALRKELEPGEDSVTTYRVVCGTEKRDYYVDEEARLKTYAGGIVYTLERPTGMEPESYEPGFSGPSFDCSKARSAGEQTICRDAALSQADRKLDAAYRRLKATMTPTGFATVQKAQRDWLSYVTKSCRSGGSMPDDIGARNALQGCLEEGYTDRSERLDALEVSKAGALVLEPRMRFFSRARPDTEESDIYPALIGGAEAEAFNAHVAKVLRLGQRRMDDKDLFPFGEEVADMKLSARRTYDVHRFDTRLVSLQVSTYDYTGGAHEALDESSLNWDLARSRAIALEDVFDKNKPWRKFVVDFCLRDLHEELAGEQEPGPDRSAIERAVGDASAWLWGKDAATVHFTVYAIASFSGGEFDVVIPYSYLEPYLRSDAPVLGGR